MVVKKIWGFLPVPVFYVDKCPGGFAGYSFSVFVLVNKKYKGDVGLVEHELTHSRQFYRTCGLHPVLYALSKSYRLKAEVEAYKTQMLYTNNPSKFAEFISTLYGLDVTADSAYKLLTENK